MTGPHPDLDAMAAAPRDPAVDAAISNAAKLLESNPRLAPKILSYVYALGKMDGTLSAIAGKV